VIVHGPPWLNFEPLYLLNLAFNGDMNPTFHSNADPDPDAKINADPDPQLNNQSATFEHETTELPISKKL
jgi:hypothetical protein